MRARVLVVTLIALAGLAYFLRAVGGSGDSEPPAERPRDLVRTDPYAASPPPAAAPLRNVFQYGEGAAPAPAPGANVSRVTPPPVVEAPAPSPSPLVRLVGLLRRGGQTRAALAIAGETVVLAAGESADGYTVISIDEDEGVRLRAPDGGTLVVTPQSE